MQPIHWLLSSLYFIVIPITLGVLARLAQAPDIHDDIDFPDDKKVMRAFEAVCISAGENGWRIHGLVEEYYIRYLRAYILHSETEDRYDNFQTSTFVFLLFSALSLLLSSGSFLIKLPCIIVLKVVFGVVAICLFGAIALGFADFRFFPHYDETDYRKNRLFLLPSLDYKSTQDDAETFFGSLGLNYSYVLSCQTKEMQDFKCRATIARWIIFVLFIAAIVVYFPR